MNSGSPHVYKFDDFHLDAGGSALYHCGNLIDEGGKKMLQVLAVFLRNPNQLISYNDLLDEVWGADNTEVTSDNVNQYISQLRRVLAHYEPGREYFVNKKGRGYIFTGEVSSPMPVSQPAVAEPVALAVRDPRPARRFFRSWHALAGLLIITLFGVSFWLFPGPNDDEEIRRVIFSGNRSGQILDGRASDKYKLRSKRNTRGGEKDGR